MSQGDFVAARFVADIEAHIGETLATNLDTDTAARNFYGSHLLLFLSPYLLTGALDTQWLDEGTVMPLAQHTHFVNFYADPSHLQHTKFVAYCKACVDDVRRCAASGTKPGLCE